MERTSAARGYTVYVIELQDGDLYVGSTAHDAYRRYHQHAVGGRLASRRTRSRCRRLRMDLCLHVSRMATRRDAELAELALAVELRARGFIVHVGV